MSRPSYDDSVFINCPFDPEYSELFLALVFAVQDCGFVPRCSLEASNSGETRIGKIYRIIRESKYGIHDISRTQLSNQKLPRFNMPLELGIFLGATEYGGGAQRGKVCLILDKAPYRYRKFCSDLAGNDPASHRNRPKQAVVRVRDWLRNARPGVRLPGGESIYGRYRQFKRDLPLLCTSARLNHKRLEFNDLRTMIGEWLKLNPP